MIITDLSGNTEYLTGYKSLKRFRSVSGDKTLAFIVLPTEQNAHSFNLVQEESVVEFDGETYRIKQMSEKPKGTAVIKEVVAIHTFYDIIDDFIYETRTGSMTFQAFLEFVFSGTDYTWDIVDVFYAQDFENFGNNNRLALFQEGIKRYEAEFVINDKHLTFRDKIGNATDFQFRYSYNIKTITRSVNTNNLSTYIKGYGKKNEDGSYLVQSEYTSPNVSIFGMRHAKPIEDERYTTLDGLNERLKAELIDTPEVSITIDFVDLRRAGYPFDVPNEGDDVFLIYEPMNLDLETRIIDITEEFSEFSDFPIKTDVTLANFRSSVVDSIINTQKQINNIIDSSGKVKYNVLDDAIKRATEALQSAQTELEFTNGIIARDKNNPNFLVLFNSNGVGISRDGGATFKEAITSEGFVLSAGAIGQLAANNIQIGPETTFSNGYDPTKIKYGGRNLITNSSANMVQPKLADFAEAVRSTFFNYSDYSGIDCVDYTDAYFQLGATTADLKGLKIGDVITFSGEFGNDMDNAEVTFFCYQGAVWNENTYLINTPTWSRFACTFTIPSGTTGFMIRIRFPRVASSNGKTIRFKKLKLEIGNVVTDWSPSLDDVRSDLHLSAPLPTSLTLNQDGITASTTSDATKYARLDYRGLFINKGAVQIQRSDGYNVIMDGVLQNGFGIIGSDPPFQTAGVEKFGGWYRVYTDNRFENVQRYVFKHDCRYLRIICNLDVDNGSGGNVGTAAFDIYKESDENTLIATGAVTETRKSNDQGYRKELLIDLGVPTGNLLVVYWRLFNSMANWYTYGNIRYVSKEG